MIFSLKTMKPEPLKAVIYPCSTDTSFVCPKVTLKIGKLTEFHYRKMKICTICSGS